MKKRLQTVYFKKPVAIAVDLIIKDRLAGKYGDNLDELKINSNSLINELLIDAIKTKYPDALSRAVEMIVDETAQEEREKYAI